jgi:hypothetical protein
MVMICKQTATHLLMVRLFFLDPNRPCIKMMGDVCLSARGFAGSWSSYASGSVENGEDVCRPAARTLLKEAGADAEVGTRTRRTTLEQARRADADNARPIIFSLVYRFRNERIPKHQTPMPVI